MFTRTNFYPDKLLTRQMSTQTNVYQDKCLPRQMSTWTFVLTQTEGPGQMAPEQTALRQVYPGFFFSWTVSQALAVKKCLRSRYAHIFMILLNPIFIRTPTYHIIYLMPTDKYQRMFLLYFYIMLGSSARQGGTNIDDRQSSSSLYRK